MATGASETARETPRTRSNARRNGAHTDRNPHSRTDTPRTVETETLPLIPGTDM